MENQELTVAKEDSRQLKTSNHNLNTPALITACTDEQVKQPIRYAMMLVGLSPANVPGEPEKAILMKFIRDNYPDYTPDEIKYAFEKAMARKFGDADVKCYGCFSCEYIGRILSAYEAWAGEGERVVPAEFGGMSYCGDRGKIEMAYERFLNGGPAEYYPASYYHTLREDRLVPEVPFRQRKRVYPKQLAILKGFAYWQNEGRKSLYVKEAATLLKAI